MARQTARSSRRLHPAVRALVAAPVVAPVVVASFGVVGTVLLLLDAFYIPLAVVLGGSLATVLVRVMGPGEQPGRGRELTLDLLAVGLALAFMLLNTRYTHQNLFVGRDPGVYAVGGQWLAHHHAMFIPYQREVFGSKAVGFASAGIGGVPGGLLYTQGAHLLPGLLGITSRLFGDAAMFRLNVVLGGLGLLSVYGFGRLIVGRGWALLATGLLGFSLPQLVFSRDTFTEPLSQLLIFGGLALVWTLRRGEPLRWAGAFLVLSAGCLARIDAFLVLPAVVVVIAAVVGSASRGRPRRLAALDGLAALAGAGIPAVLGRLDLQRLSSGYFKDLHGQFSSISQLLLITSVVSVVGVLLAWSTPGLRWLEVRAPRWQPPLSRLLVGGVLLTGVALAARPLFGEQHFSSSPRATPPLTLVAQVVAPVRSYTENSVTWLTWYFGVATTVLGLLGAALLLHRCVQSRSLTLVPFLLVFLSTSLLYLYKPSIAPDHIWAMRRYLPVVLPGLVLSAVVALERAFRFLPRGPMVRSPAAVAAGLLLAVPVATTTWPVLRVREGSPQLAEVHRICDALPGDAAVLVLGSIRQVYPQTVRSYCDLPVGSVAAIPPGLLSSVAAHAATRGRRLFVVCADGATALAVSRPGSPEPRPVSSILVVSLTKPHDRPPRAVNGVHRSMYVGSVGTDGLVTWVHSQGGR